MPPYIGGIPDKQPAERGDLVAFQRRLPPEVWRGLSQPLVRAGTVGSGEDLLVVAWSASMLQWEKDTGAAMLAKFGVQAGMRVANTLPGALTTPGSLLLGDVVEQLGGLDIPLGEVRNRNDAHQAWKTLTLLRADIVITDRRGGALLLEEAPRLVELPTLAGWIWLTDDPCAPLPALAPQLGHVWQRCWLAVPEAQSFFAASCPSGAFHLQSAERVEVVEHPPLDPLCGRLVVRGHRQWQEPDVVLPWPARRSARPCACGRDGVIEFADSGS